MTGSSAAAKPQNRYLVFGVLAFGQFIAQLDIQIVAASLNQLQAGLSAGPDEISWVQTAYLMAELIMIPLSGFLAQAMSTRTLFALSAGLFTVASILCGFAWDIQSMAIFRAVQGFVGGAMIPSVFAVGFSLFPKERGMIAAILGIVSTLAPTLGPTVGGIITDALDWHWLFFINIVPGVLVTLGTLRYVHVDTANPEMFKKIDFAQLGALAIALGGMEYVLEEGPRHDWFGDPTIKLVAWFALVALVLFVERSLFSKSPVVRINAFRSPTFAIACVFNLLIGFGVYASTFLTPIFLGRVRDYTSLDIGTTVFVVGIGQVLGTIVAARLIDKIDPRYIIGTGLLGFCFTFWMTAHMSADWGFWDLMLPQFFRGVFALMCIVPSVTLALGGFQGPDLRYASGLYNLMRNLGGAIGIALVNTWLQDSARLHGARFGEAMGHNGTAARDVVSGVARAFSAVTADPGRAAEMSRGAFAHLVGRQSLTLAFDDVFQIMSWMFLAVVLMVPFCRPPVHKAAPNPDAH